ncbi:MAG: RNA polymerase sigma factor, partial [Hormoscilla sp.]
MEIFFSGAIGELPERLRETFILYFEKEYSYKEIAAELNISYANARKRISQARAILREQHQEYEAGVSPSDGTPLKTQNKPETSTLVETRTFVSSGERVWSKPVDRTSHTPVAGSPQTPLRKGGFRKPPLLEGGVWGGSS